MPEGIRRKEGIQDLVTTEGKTKMVLLLLLHNPNNKV